MSNYFADKISTYQIFNYLFPGSVFLAVMGNSGWHLVFQMHWALFIVFAYFSGMILSRLGSLIIECAMLRMGYIEKVDFEKMTVAEIKDSKVTVFLEIANTYRTLSAMFACMFGIFLFNLQACVPLGLEVPGLYYWLALGGFFLFTVSFCKQYKYVCGRVESVCANYEKLFGTKP